jgi:hypothetical protein
MAILDGGTNFKLVTGAAITASATSTNIIDLGIGSG